MLSSTATTASGILFQEKVSEKEYIRWIIFVSQTYWLCMYVLSIVFSDTNIQYLYFLCSPQSEEGNSCVMIKGHILDLPYIKGHVDTWLTSLAPTIGESACSWTIKTLTKKKPLWETRWQKTLYSRKIVTCGNIKSPWGKESFVEPSLQKYLLLKEKSCKLLVTFVTYIVGCLV